MESFSEYTVAAGPHMGRAFRYKSLKKITSHTDAYFLGHLSMDGSFEKRRNIMSIDSTSIKIVEFFHRKYSPDSPFNIIEPRSSDKVNGVNKIAKTTFVYPLSEDLGRYGIRRYKHDRIAKGIPKKYMCSFFLGQVDAEGWFTVRHRKDCRTPRLNFGMRTSAKKLNMHMQRYLERELGISMSLYDKGKMNEIRIHNVETCCKFVRYIYSVLPDIYNSRKYDKVFKYLRQYG